MYRQKKPTQYLKGRYCDPCEIFYPSNQTGYITDCPKCFKPLTKCKSASKYRNKKVEWRGTLVDSKKERNVAMETDYLLKAGQIKGYSRQVSFPLYANGFKICTYIADIVVDHLDGTKEIIEVKSWITDRLSTWRMKRNLLEATYLKENPTWRLTVLK